MSKPLILITAPIATRSGYGNHSRDISRALIESGKYDIKINPVRWGGTPMNALEDNNPHHLEIYKRLLNGPRMERQPDLHIHIVIPNEFQPIGKKNLGITAGIEHTLPPGEWLDGVNKMDMTIFTSEFSKKSFEEVEFTRIDKDTQREIAVKEDKLKWNEISCSPTLTNFEKFIESIIQNKNHEPDFERGAEIQNILDKCFESNKDGKWVNV